MPEELPSSIRQQEVIVRGQRLRLHFLDNGQRVVEAESAEMFFQWLTEQPVSEAKAILADLRKALRGCGMLIHK